MRKYVIQRFIQLIPVLIGITFLSFAMMRMAGSDAITELYGDKGTVAQEVIDAKKAELGLDKPFVTQYFTWLGGMLTGDMGTSYVSGKEVFPTFVSKLPATLLLTALSILMTVVMSVFDFDLEKCKEYVWRRNPNMEIIPICAKTGEGIQEWTDWLREQTRAWIK